MKHEDIFMRSCSLMLKNKIKTSILFDKALKTRSQCNAEYQYFITSLVLQVFIPSNKWCHI